jgi:hypothetical protein
MRTSNFDNFDRDFNRMWTFIKFFFILVLGLTLLGIGFQIFLILNPELIGEFFGRVVAGFKGAQ